MNALAARFRAAQWWRCAVLTAHFGAADDDAREDMLMTQIVRRTIPAVVTRSVDAFRAGDSVSIGEAFEAHAMLVSHVDPKFMSLLGIADPDKPVRTRGNLSIMQYFARVFTSLQITYADLHSEIRVGRELAAICDYEAKLLATGKSVSVRCMGFCTLSPTGRKLESARTVCTLVTPGWDYAFN